MPDIAGEQGQRNSRFPRDIRKKDRIKREFPSAVEILDHAHMLLLGGAETTKTVRDTARELEDRVIPSHKISGMQRVWLREFLPGKARNLDKALDEKYKDPKRSRAGRTRGAKIALAPLTPVLATKLVEYPAANNEGTGRILKDIIVAASSEEGPLTPGFIGLYSSYGRSRNVIANASGNASGKHTTTSGYVSLSGVYYQHTCPATLEAANSQPESGVSLSAISGSVTIGGLYPDITSQSSILLAPIAQLHANTSGIKSKVIENPSMFTLAEIEHRPTHFVPGPNSQFWANPPAQNILPQQTLYDPQQTLYDPQQTLYDPQQTLYDIGAGIGNMILDFLTPKPPEPTKYSGHGKYFRF